jgi:5'/3'-nucleotidase
MPQILVTNDDGVHSDGIHALADAMRALGDVLVVAPHVEASAIGHALTLRRPLRVEPLRDGVYEVDGTPTDCVNIALTKLYTSPPDLIVSGINKGYNLGDDVTYSGTVSGALEGALLGVPSIAVSQERTRGAYDFRHAAAAAAKIAAIVLRQGIISPQTFLSINVPTGVPRGFRLTVQARRNHVTTVDERVDPRGRPYYWIEEGENEWEPHDRSDFQAVRDGYVSVTPLQPDMTDHAALTALESLALDKHDQPA